MLPGFKYLNIFLHVMYCNGAKYLLLKVFISNSGAISTCTHCLSGNKANIAGTFILSTNTAQGGNGNVEIKRANDRCKSAKSNPSVIMLKWTRTLAAGAREKEMEKKNHIKLLPFSKWCKTSRALSKQNWLIGRRNIEDEDKDRPPFTCLFF